MRECVVAKSVVAKLIFGLCLGLLIYASPSMADERKPAVNDRAQAAEKAQQAVAGRVLRVEPKETKYRVKLLQKSGRVVSLDVDKQSGKVKPAKEQKKYR